MKLQTQTLRIGIIVLLTCSIAALFTDHTTNAAPVTGFNAGRIIEDSVFTNSTSMSVSQIQSFLNSRVATCDTWGTQTSEYGGGTRAQWGAARGTPAPFVCLKDYSEGGKSAAQIIYDAAREFTINPQVLIVLLQKEQGLVTDTWPLPSQYRTATGYGCPDTAPCDSQYYGLTNQLRWSGRMFRAILNNSPTWYTPYILGNNYVRWNPTASCGGSTVNIENRSTQALYNYTPYRPNQAALNAGYGMGDNCSAYGNRNFYLYFKDWFGYNAGPVAFKTTSSPTIYVSIEGYKLAVPYMAAMQDYGISADAIQTVSQEYVDAVPNPPQDSGISSSIAHVVKSPRDDDEDGGSIYLISRGQRFQIQTMQQFYDFGFTEADISYLPLSYILYKPSGGMLPYFVTSPYGSVFKVENGTKRIIFEYSTYITQNPSDRVAPLSYFLTDKLPSGHPLTDRPVLIKYSTGESVRLYINSAYYGISNYDTLNCWGFESTLKTPVYRVPKNDYLATTADTSTLSCLNQNGGAIQVLSKDSRYTIPSNHGFTALQLDNNLKAIADKLPLRSFPLKSYIKSTSSAAVWVVENGKRRGIPSYTSFLLLGIKDSDVDTVDQSTVDKFSYDGLKLANGQLVKDTSSAAVYTIANNSRVLYATSNSYTAYGNTWDSIETYPTGELNTNYPFTGSTIGNYLVNKQAGVVYVIANNGCFTMTEDSLARFGTSYSELNSVQSYDIDSVRKVNLNCSPSTAFIKQPYDSLVYWVDSGKKHPLNTYSAMLSKNGGVSPKVMIVESEFLSTLPSGPPIQ